MEVGVSMTLPHHVTDNRGSPEHKSTTPHVQLSPQKNNHNKYEEHGAVSQVSSVLLYGVPIVSLVIDRQERLCLAQISNTLLKEFSYNEIHNRRVALGITCVQCTPVQLEILRRAGAMPISSRRCGMITKREAERLCKSFLGDNSPPKLPDHFAFEVFHECAWGCRGSFVPSRYNSSRAKCIKCTFCNLFFSPNKFIFHSHRLPDSKYVQPDAANFNSWRRHMKLSGTPPEEVVHAWEDVKAMFNGGTRKRMLSTSSPNSSAPQPPPKAPKVSNSETRSHYTTSKNKNTLTLPPPPPPPPAPPRPEISPYGQPLPPSPSAAMSPRVPPIPSYPEKPPIQHPYDLHRSFVDYVWSHQPASPQHKPFHFAPYSLPWLKRPLLAFGPAAVAAAAAVASETGLPEAPPLTPLSQAQPASAAAAAAAAAAALSHHLYTSAFRPVGQLKVGSSPPPPPLPESGPALSDEEEETVDIETTEDDTPAWVIPPRSTTPTPHPHSPSPGLPPSASQMRESPGAPEAVENGCPASPPSYDEGPVSPRSVSPRRPMSPEPPRRVVSPEQRGAWVRVSQQDQRRHQQQAQYRHEVARQLHIMRELAASPEHAAPQQREILRELAAERRARLNVQAGRIKDAQNALHHLSNKMALDCSSCHAYQESNISP